MDILKKATSNMQDCKISDNKVEVLNRSYDGEMIIEFPTKKSKEYNLKSVIFYLMNANIPLKDYVTNCQEKNILPVGYLDQASIKTDINNFKSTSLSGFFFRPVYGTGKKYEIPYENNENYILVSNNILSTINIGNIMDVMDNNYVSNQSVTPFFSESKKYERDGIQYVIYNDASKFTDSDWNKVKVVFLDGFKSQIKSYEKYLALISKNAAIFSFDETDEINSHRLILEGDKIKNHQEMWKIIDKYVNK